MKNKNIVVTGSTGFIGMNLVDEISKTNAAHLFSPRGFRWFEAIEDIKPDLIIHLSSMIDSELGEDTVFAENVVDFCSVIDAARLVKCPVLYTSSAAVYGNQKDLIDPLTPYARSKALMEVMAQFCYKDVPSIGIRPFNVYGPGETHKGKDASMIHKMISAAIENKPIKLFKDGNQCRDFVYVADVVSCLVLAADLLLTKNHSRYYPLDCGSGQSVSYNQIIKVIEAKTGKKLNVEYIDCPADFRASVKSDVEPTKAVLGYSPAFDLEKGIEAYLANWTKFVDKTEIPF